MKKIAIVYYSGTGNTEAMAEIIATALEGKAETEFIKPEDFTLNRAKQFDSIALGCPAMGNETLEEDVFEPMFASLEGNLSGIKLALFGSYGWGDGEWMRSWRDRCQDADLVAEPVICQESPDAKAEDELKALAEELIKG